MSITSYPSCPSAIVSCPHTQLPAAIHSLFSVLEGLQQKRGRGVTRSTVTVESLLLNYIRVAGFFSDEVVTGVFWETIHRVQGALQKVEPDFNLPATEL